jgi:urease accessory protein UreH
LTRALDSRVPAAVGRHARLELVFEKRRGRTIVAHAYAEPPFRIATFDIDDAAYVMIVCSGPGVFAGDVLHQSVRVGAGARAVLTSQSALQIHPGGAPPAAVRHEYRVDRDAELHCHWDPMIPFPGASLAQSFHIDADPGARMYWSDALMAGRLSRGEAWRFESLAHELWLRVGGVPKYLERFRLIPRDRPLTPLWIAGAAGYFATTLVSHPRVASEVAETLHRRFEGDGAARLGVDVLEPGLMIVRAMASSGAAFAAVRTAIRGVAVDSIFQQPNLVGRK